MIKNKRKEKGFSQEYVARILNISLRHYQNIENYRTIPNVLLAIKISKILDSNIEDLFNESYYKS